MAGPPVLDIVFVFDADQSARPYCSRQGGNFCRLTLFLPRLMLDAQELVNTMKKSLLATVAIVAFSVPSFAAEIAKTVGQSSLSFYLAQDTATLKCQIVEIQPVAGSSVKVFGAAQRHQQRRLCRLTKLAPSAFKSAVDRSHDRALGFTKSTRYFPNLPAIDGCCDILIAMSNKLPRQC
jgi:hypothetical protein